MNVVFSKRAWEEYLYWQTHDKNVLKRINALLKDITRNPFEGIGDPEPLRYEFSGYWSRRINLEHRFVYKVVDDDLVVFSLRFHYE